MSDFPDSPESKNAPADAVAARRTVVKGAAWTIPVVIAAGTAPSAAASVTPPTITGTAPAAAGTCTTFGTIQFSVRQNGAGVAGQAVVVTLPTGFSWSDTTTAPKTLISDANGEVIIVGVKAASKPGAYVATGLLVSTNATATVPLTVTGNWLTSRQGYGGTGVVPVYINPSDTANLGAPDNWAYCIEHNETIRTPSVAHFGDPSSFLGSNLYTGDSTVQAKVAWVLAHSHPTLSLAAFGAAVGVPNIARNDALEAAQYAIWRYTDVGYDSAWNWETADSQTAYWYLVNGANADTSTVGVGTVVSVAQTDCGTPTSGDHRQTLILTTPVS
ncbi:Cys-Gln thioester bond-forming surface protein [Microbacteriaceae bacterium VKM Ac-2854]|nr:Cys-Gln thioester bond-forming surface protein [Microbacteriaceae bacterium VKM Ac-2854]